MDVRLNQRKPREEFGMDAGRIIDRFGRRWLGCALGAMFTLGQGTGSAQAADPCSQSAVSRPFNSCENQVQAPISYSGWETKSWAYYCSGDHPHFAKGNDGVAWDNTCFTNTENLVAENDNFDGDFTNWCLNDQSLVAVLACYEAPCCD